VLVRGSNLDADRRRTRVHAQSGDGVESRMGTTVAGMAGHYRESVELIESVRPGSAFLPALEMQLHRLAEEASGT
jgi:hypothetical protein